MNSKLLSILSVGCFAIATQASSMDFLRDLQGQPNMGPPPMNGPPRPPAFYGENVTIPYD